MLRFRLGTRLSYHKFYPFIILVTIGYNVAATWYRFITIAEINILDIYVIDLNRDSIIMSVSLCTLSEQPCSEGNTLCRPLKTYGYSRSPSIADGVGTLLSKLYLAC